MFKQSTCGVRLRQSKSYLIVWLLASKGSSYFLLLNVTDKVSDKSGELTP